MWTISLPHRTQILYAPDMAFVTLKLNLSPGAAVIEAGTGSGSFTHSLARTVACGPPIADQPAAVWKGAHDGPPRAPSPTGGRVWSFEFHRDRVERAQKEFAAHGLDRTVVLEHRNVCRDGFGVADAADALFLDLPAPWDAIPHAPAALKKRELTRICCFSPCIEQVLRTITALSEHGFTDIATYESLVRTHDSITNVAPLEPISTVVERIREHERKREARRLVQIAQSRAERARKEAAQAQAHGEAPAPALPAKRKAESAPVESAPEEPAPAPAEPSPEEPAPAEPPAEILYNPGFGQKVERRRIDLANVYSRPYPQMRGHTSYLTFAVLLPRA